MSDHADGGRRLVLRCAWCDRIRDDQHVWHAVPREQVEALEAANRLTHGMCPRCYERLTGESLLDT